MNAILFCSGSHQAIIIIARTRMSLCSECWVLHFISFCSFNFSEWLLGKPPIIQESNKSNTFYLAFSGNQILAGFSIGNRIGV